MLTAELRINGRLVAAIDIQNDGLVHEQSGGERADYDLTLFDMANGAVTKGRVQGFARSEGPLALLREALDAV